MTPRFLVFLIALALVAPPAAALEVTGASDVTGAPAAASRFLFAEGTTREGFQEYLTLLNPSPSTVTATITYDTADGLSGARARIVSAVPLPPGRTTVDVNRVLGPNQDVSARVETTSPIVAERPLYATAVVAALGTVSGGSTVIGPADPATHWLFAEGTTRPGFQEYLTLLNPADHDVAVTLNWSTSPATTLTLPPGRSTVDVNAVLGPDLDVSVSVEAAEPIVAERPIYFAADLPSVGPLTGITDALGATAPTAAAVFAEGSTRAGFQEYLTLLNPAPEPVTVTITYDLTASDTGERRRLARPQSLPPGRSTIDVNESAGPDQDVSVALAADGPLAVERSLYVNRGVGAAGPVTGASAVPGLAPGGDTAVFAEGTTRTGFQEYLTLANPAEDTVRATVTYDVVEAATGRRSHVVSDVAVDPGRTTLDINREVGVPSDVSIAVAGPVQAERPLYFRHDFPSADSIRRLVSNGLASPALAGVTVGLSMWVEGFGEVAGQNADLALTPASNEKLFTAAAALATWGVSTTLSTSVLSTANGDLFLKGGGDPQLASTGPGDSLDALAAQLQATGLVTVNGRLVGDETRWDAVRTAPGWKATYLPDGDVGPLSALAVDENYHPTDPAYLVDPVPRNIDAFRDALVRHGLTGTMPGASGPAPDDAITVARVSSAPMGRLVQDMLTYSDNLTAEMLLKEMGQGTTAGGVDAMAAALTAAGLPAEGTATDGSGLSIADLRSAQTERLLLQGVTRQSWAGTFIEGLPLAGSSGTLADRFKGTAAENNLRAKTGTLNGVRALSGYFTTTSGRHVVFSMLANHAGTSLSVRDAMDDIVAQVAADGS